MRFDQFIGSFYTDQSPSVNCEDAINVYTQIIESGDGESSKALYRSPGLVSKFTAPAPAPGTASLGLNGFVWCAIGTTIYKLSWDGAQLLSSATYGPIVSDGTRAQFVASPTQVVVYSVGHAYCITLADDNFAEITWPAVALAGIGFINQYFVFLSAFGDGFFYSEPSDATSGDPLNFRSAEASATKYISMVVAQEMVWLFGNGPTSQVFYNDADDANEPFKPNLSAVIPQGTIAAAVPIWIPEVGRIFWIDESGIARGNNGYTAERLSNHAVEAIWYGYGDISDAVSWSAVWNGNIMWRVWFPSADVTWEYNTAMPPGQGWGKVLAWNSTQGQFTAHRGMSSCKQFGMQFVADRSNGQIYVLSPSANSDAGEVIRWLRRAPVLVNENKNVDYDWFELRMQTGLGDGSNGDPTQGDVTPEFDPHIMIRYSNDWGRNWSNEMLRSLGKQGDYGKRVYIDRCGMSRWRVWEVSGSAKVGPIAISACYLGDPEALAS